MVLQYSVLKPLSLYVSLVILLDDRENVASVTFYFHEIIHSQELATLSAYS